MLVGLAVYARVQEVLSHEHPPSVSHQGVVEGYVTQDTPVLKLSTPLGVVTLVSLGAAVKWSYCSSASECSLVDSDSY